MPKKKSQEHEDQGPTTPLQRAAALSDLPAVKRLLLEGADIHEMDAEGRTALWFAVSVDYGGGSGHHDRLKIIRLLRKHGAVVDLRIVDLAFEYSHPEHAKEFPALGLSNSKSYDEQWSARGGVVINVPPKTAGSRAGGGTVSQYFLVDPQDMCSLYSLWRSTLRLGKGSEQSAARLERHIENLVDTSFWNLLMLDAQADLTPFMKERLKDIAHLLSPKTRARAKQKAAKHAKGPKSKAGT
jgi:hypothetical protein